MNTQNELRARARQSLRAGRIDEAIGDHQALLGRYPGDADAWYNLGYLLRCARRYDEALAAYDQAIGRGIARPEEVHLNRAVILSEFRNRPEAARAELDTAVRLRPGFLTAWLNLGNLHEDDGDRDAARAAYRQALSIDPDNGRALARLATIDVFSGEAQPVIDRLPATMSRAGMGADAVAEMGFALGHALDAQGRYDDAFAAFSAANLAARQAAGTDAPYDAIAQTRLIDSLIAMPKVTGEVRGGDASAVFVCGMFRSGSTLIEQILSRHSAVTAGGELEYIPAMVAQLHPYPASLDRLSAADLGAMRHRYEAEARLLHPDARLLTDKRPDNFLHIGLIKRLFPDARIIHTVRNPLDTILSIYFLYFDDSIRYGHRLEDIAHWYVQYHRLMQHWKTNFPDSIHDVSYDLIVRDPRSAIMPMLDFCRLDWEETMPTPAGSDGPVRTASVWQVRQPLHQRSSGRWRHYARHLDRVRDILGDLADQAPGCAVS